MKFKVILKPDSQDGGYNISCPALPGCHSQGDTIEEAVSNIQDARVSISTLNNLNFLILSRRSVPEIEEFLNRFAGTKNRTSRRAAKK